MDKSANIGMAVNSLRASAPLAKNMLGGMGKKFMSGVKNTLGGAARGIIRADQGIKQVGQAYTRAGQAFGRKMPNATRGIHGWAKAVTYNPGAAAVPLVGGGPVGALDPVADIATNALGGSASAAAKPLVGAVKSFFRKGASDCTTFYLLGYNSKLAELGIEVHE